MPTISVPQVRAFLGDKERNLKTIEKCASKSGEGLLLFPEIFLTGYMVRDDMRRFAELLDGPSAKRVSKLAKKTGKCIVFGMAEKDSERSGVIYNSAVVASADGELGAYRKMYLANFGPFEERIYFAPGKEAALFETPVGKMGVTICFDLFFPELSRLYTLKGADVVACISASPSATRPFFEKILVARAIENSTFVAYSNHVGTQRDFVFWGGNCVLGPRGEYKAKGKPYVEDAGITAKIAPHEIELARPHRPTIKESRQDVFDELDDL